MLFDLVFAYRLVDLLSLSLVVCLKCKILPGGTLWFLYKTGGWSFFSDAATSPCFTQCSVVEWCSRRRPCWSHCCCKGISYLMVLFEVLINIDFCLKTRTMDLTRILQKIRQEVTIGSILPSTPLYISKPWPTVKFPQESPTENRQRVYTPGWIILKDLERLVVWRCSFGVGLSSSTQIINHWNNLRKNY